MRTAILLDSQKKTITEVEVGEGIDDIYKHLKCSTFDVVSIQEGVDMFVDDESLLKEAYIDENGNKHNMTGIKIHGYSQVIMGNGLLMGIDNKGESVNCPVPVSEVESKITFVEYDNPDDRPQPFMDAIFFCP